MNPELESLKKKLLKDKEQSEFRISTVQKEIQFLVKERKEERTKWEQSDVLAEGEISERVQEISEIQGRLLASEELIKQLEQLTF